MEKRAVSVRVVSVTFILLGFVGNYISIPGVVWWAASLILPSVMGFSIFDNNSIFI
jgi:hypothetical protein